MTRLSRRDLMKAGALALAAPAVLRASDARASSGALAVYAWNDYFANNTLLADFTNATGVNVTLTTYGSNAEAEAKLRASGGKGIDIFFPSIDTGPNYYRDNLLRPIDEARFKAEVLPAFAKRSLDLGAADRGRRHLVPMVWGTEGLTWDSTKFAEQSGGISYGDMWLPANPKQTALRPTSIFNAMALYLDANGTLKSNRGLDLYKAEAQSRAVFDGVLGYITAHKANIATLWNTAAEATAAFATGGCSIGHTPDTTGILLGQKTDPKWVYGMPKEGGLGTMDGIAIPSGAANVEQAYAFANFLYQEDVAARFANTTRRNSCAKGAANYMSAENRAAFDAAYPAGAIDNLFWLPAQTETYVTLRAEYAGKLAKG